MAVQNTPESFTVNIPTTNPEKVQKAYEFLSNEYVESTRESFTISTETVANEDMLEYAKLLMEQHTQLAENLDFRKYIDRLKFNQGGEQFVKAFGTGEKNFMLMSVVVCKRIGNQTKILFATLEKAVEFQKPSSIETWKDGFWSILGYKPKSQDIEKYLTTINMEESKRCMEALAYHLTAKSIYELMGTHVHINFMPITNDTSTKP